MTPISGWENFHVIVGSSAGALIGLQFVVVTLIAETPNPHARSPNNSQASRYFRHLCRLLCAVKCKLAGRRPATVNGMMYHASSGIR